ncbi:MAG: Ig-like domain-containing protein, partial [Anaerolineae bacterium]|nr:Ig-like domain-containing protein [Anaerolineae bacterium]
MANHKSQIGKSENQQIEDHDDPVEAALRYKVAQINPDPNFVTRLAMQLRRARKLQSAPAPRRIPLWGWLGAAIATVLVATFAAQAFLPGGDKLPAGTPEIAQALPTTTTRPVATVAPTAPEPTNTAAPTPEPEPAFAADLPPAVVSAIPRPGEEVRTEAGILLRFSRAMNRASVESALRITPQTEGTGSESVEGATGPVEGTTPELVEGTFTWQDDTTVTFTPKVLAAGTRYNVALDVTAQADNGLPLTSDLVFSFSTLDALTVTHSTPADSSSDLRGDTPVLVVLNHPMVPINCSGQVAAAGSSADADCPPLPLAFSPGVVGQGTWINTSAYRFDPLPAWDAGTVYTAQIPAGVTSIAGATLNEAITWTFTTAQAQVIRIEPEVASTNTPLDTGVRVIFNTPMDAQTTAAAFSLSDPDGNSPPGSVTWEDNNATLVFTPTQNLALNTDYIIRVTDEARAVNGGILEDGLVVGIFKTAPYPSVVNITGTDESTSGNTLSYYESLRVEFRGLIDQDTLGGHFRLTENGDPVEVSFWWDNYENNN